MDRVAVRNSAAYLAMTPAARRVLSFIESEIDRSGDGAAIPLTMFAANGICRAAARFGVKQCERLGFVSIGTGLRHANTFRLVDGWRAVDTVEARRQVLLARLPKLPQPRCVAASPPVKPPKPAPKPKPVVEQPRTVQQRGVTLPRLSFMDDHR